MPSIELGTWGAANTVLTTELNSLANGSTALSGVIDNSTELCLWDILELVVTFGVAPVLNTTVEVYLLGTVDDTNYSDGTAGTPGVVPAPGKLVAVFMVRAVTSAQRIVLPPWQKVEIPPGMFKYLLRNQAGQTMAASGNTLKRRAYEMSST